MMNGVLKIALTGVLLVGLSGCSNNSDDEGTGPFGILAQRIGQVVAERRGGAEPAAPAKSPQNAAAEALRVNRGPLIQVGFESLDSVQVLGLTGQNGAMRTYMTPAEEALILRNGMLIGTRGLGNDLSVAKSETEALIRAGASGTGTRIMRYYTGDGLERPLQFACTVGAGPRAGVTVETCQGHGATFQNSYMVQGGQILVSRQWVGPALGYFTIQTLRP